MKPAFSTPIQKVAIIGPECTGKSALSAFLADYYNTTWVKEYAREYIEQLSRPYSEADLPEIAKGQLRLEDEAMRKANGILFCDTNLYVIKIWSAFRFGRIDDSILTMMQERHYDLYLLTNTDIPWEEDPQREHPHKRVELYSLYLSEMKAQSVPFVEIDGEGDARNEKAVRAVNKFIKTL